jgi:hypothetical protein
MVAATGFFHGRWTRRWATPYAIEAGVAALRRVPLTLGDWRGRPFELGREQLAVAEIDGYVARRYTDVRGVALTLLLVFGRPGPIAVHTPDVCYAGAGFESTEPPAERTLRLGPDGRVARFRYAAFGKTNSVAPVYLHIYWAWSSDGTWEAPDDPRLTFASRQALYKLYVISETATAERRPEDDPSLTFLQTLLPELERDLFTDL